MDNLKIEDILKKPIIKVDAKQYIKGGKVARVGIFKVVEGEYKPKQKTHKTCKLSDII